MWKQFLDLIPHLSRLLPHIDRFVQQRSAGDDAQKKNLEQFQQMTEGLRADLAQATASHESLYRQLNDQGEKMSALAADLHNSRAALQSIESRMEKLETAVSIVRSIAGATMLFTIFILFFVIWTHLHH